MLLPLVLSSVLSNYISGNLVPDLATCEAGTEPISPHVPVDTCLRDGSGTSFIVTFSDDIITMVSYDGPDCAGAPIDTELGACNSHCEEHISQGQTRYWSLECHIEGTQTCVNADSFEVSCPTAAHLGICDKTLPDGTLVRDRCQQSCGCCSQGEQCRCANNDQVHKIARTYGAWWVRTCEDALKVVHCDNPKFAARLAEHCPCHCPSVQQ